MKKIKSFVKSALSVYYLVLIVLTIPLAFDVGGLQCGLAYSLTLMTTYFALTTLRLVSRRFPILRVISILYYVQHLFIPSVLMVFLSMYNPDEEDAPLPAALSVWRYILIHLTLIFTIAEGFCSLLLIQAAGQTLNWLTTYKSDSWLFVSLIGSGATITGALYFLYRIYVNPFSLELGNASLLGSFLTLTMSLGLYGIVSRKGSMIESSLLFAYIVRCIYETFPFFSEDASQTITNLFTQTTLNLRKEITRLPQPVSETILSALPLLASNIPNSFRTIWTFFLSAIQKLSLPLLFNLAYRIGVFYAATKIIPLLYHGIPFLPPRTPLLGSRQVLSSSVSTLQLNPQMSEIRPDIPRIRRPSGRISFRKKPKAPSTILTLIYAFSPCIIIAVYTHLMLLYSGELGTELKLWGWWDGASPDSMVVVHPWQFWNWVNMSTTLVLYIAELGGNTDANSAMTSHWKVD